MVAVATKKKTSKKAPVKSGTKEKSKSDSRVVKEKPKPTSVKTKAKVQVEEFVAVGRRKSSIARVRLSKGTGVWQINGKEIDRTTLSDDIQAHLLQPFRTIEDENGFNFRAFTSGGGFMGQTQAVVLGIARALEKMNPEWRLPLKKAGLLTRDSRVKERKKPGRPGARKRFQFSKR